MQMFWNYSQYNFSYIFHLVNSSHKNTLHFYFQLDCKVIVDLFNFFYCVDQGQHWATQEGHLIKIKHPHQQWTGTRLWMFNFQSLAKSRGTQRSFHWRGLFFLMDMFVNFLFWTHMPFVIMVGKRPSQVTTISNSPCWQFHATTASSFLS